MTRELTPTKPFPFRCLHLLDTEHVRWNELGHHGARASLEVRDYDGTHNNPEAWTSITLREFTTDKRGRVTERVISITLRPDERAALIRTLTGEA